LRTVAIGFRVEKPGFSENRVSGRVSFRPDEGSGETASRNPPLSPAPQTEPPAIHDEPAWTKPAVVAGPPDWSVEAPPAGDFAEPVETPEEPAPESEFVPRPEVPAIELEATRVPPPPEDRHEQFLAESTAVMSEGPLGVADRGDLWREADPPREGPLRDRGVSSSFSSTREAIERLPSRDEPDVTLPDVRDLAVTIEKSQPESAAATRPVSYDITIRNDGGTAIDQLIVEEHVAPPHRIVDASGRPAFDDEANALRWEIRDLQPAAYERFKITVEAKPADRAPWAALSSTTTVHPAVTVSGATTVEPQTHGSRTHGPRPHGSRTHGSRPVGVPLFAVRRISLLEAAVGRPVRCTNRIINRSGHDLLRVTVTERISAGMELIALDDNGCFDEGTRTVTWLVGTLPADGEAFRSLVLRPRAAGVQRSVITTTAEGQAGESFEATLEVPTQSR
ncbi:MAG: hypothetical protein ACREJB_06065, partial [Planctomycetaceae bacterium]